MYTLSASFRNEWNMLTTMSNRSKRDITLRLIIRSGQFSNLCEISSIYASFMKLICKFHEHLIKAEEVMVMTNIFHCKSMEPCGCHSNQSFHWIFMKSWCHQSPIRHATDEKWLRSACRLWRYNWSKVLTDDGQRTDGRLSYKLPWSLRPRWAKNQSKNFLTRNFFKGFNIDI